MIILLYITFRETENTVWNVDATFNNLVEPVWFADDLVKKMVLDVDNSTVISDKCVESPIFGIIPITKISGGVKALILMYKRPDLEVWATACGDNCAKWILRIAEMQDIHISLTHIMEFSQDFEAVCTDRNVFIHTYKEYIMEAILCLNRKDCC